MSIPVFVMGGVLSCHECFFCPIKDDQTVFDNRQAVCACIQQIAALQNLTIVDDGPIRVSEVAEIEGDADEKDRGHLGLLLSYLFDL